MRAYPIREIGSLMYDALKIRNVDERTSELIVEDYLGAQLEGHTTHGIGKFLLIDAALAERQGRPEIVKQGAAYAFIDGHRELGHACAILAMDALVPRARGSGIAVVAVVNASRYGRLKVLGKMIADAGLAGIVLNNAGPAAVAPHGAVDPILGTNPVCFSFPATGGHLLIDFSTSKRVWGEIRQAMLEGRQLPEEAFLDKTGSYTRDPQQAEAVVSFGDSKGYALCLAIEILAGALVGAKMGLDVATQFDLGFVFIALDPALFSTLATFGKAVQKLEVDIRGSRPRNPLAPVLIPGDKSAGARAAAEKDGLVSVDQETYARLVKMSKEAQGGIESSNKTD